MLMLWGYITEQVRRWYEHKSQSSLLCNWHYYRPQCLCKNYAATRKAGNIYYLNILLLVNWVTCKSALALNFETFCMNMYYNDYRRLLIINVFNLISTKLFLFLMFNYIVLTCLKLTFPWNHSTDCCFDACV